MSAHRTDRQLVEAMLPSWLFWSVMIDGVKDPDAPDHAEVIMLLDQATEAEIVGLPAEHRRKLLRRAKRLHTIATAEFRRQGIEVGKFGLIVFYLFAKLRDAGLFSIVEGGPLDLALETLLPAIADWTAVPEVDASAQKQARRLLRLLQDEGYYRELVAA